MDDRPRTTDDAAAWSVVHRLSSVLLDLLYPPRCGGCDTRGALFCDDCLRSITPARADTRSLAGVKALICVGAFSGPLREAIHKLKYEGDTPLAVPLARLIYDALQKSVAWPELQSDPTVLVPVPLHPQRERARGFNQAFLLARELSRLTGWPVAKELVRARSTRSQVGLDVEERHDNVRGAFACVAEAPARVLLVDDVCTTGATLLEYARTLRMSGTQQVYVAAVGRATGAGPTSDR